MNIQKFIDDENYISTLNAFEFQNLGERELNTQQFDYSKAYLKTEHNNFWHFLFYSLPHLEKFNEMAEKALSGRRKEQDRILNLLVLMKKNVNFSSSATVGVFDLIGAHNLLGFDLEQNKFIHLLTPDNYKQNLNSQNICDFWAEQVEPQQRDYINTFKQSDNTVSSFLSIYPNLQSGRDQIYLFSLLAKKVEKYSNDEKQKIAFELNEKINERDTIIEAVSQYHLFNSINTHICGLLTIGAIYTRNEKARQYMIENAIEVERDKLKNVILPAQSKKTINKI